LEEKQRKSDEKKRKEKNCQKSSGSLPDGKEVLISKTLLIEMKERSNHKGSGWPLTGDTEASISLFKPNL
jgi:hypothetical protein